VGKSVPFEWGYGSTPRVAGLRDALCWKSTVVKEWVNVAMGIAKCEFRQGIKVDLDRGRLVTKAYRETEGQPWAIRRARAVQMLCEEMPIYIKPGELIVGDANGAPDEIRFYPEFSVAWMPDGVTTGGFSEMVTDEERREIVEDICEYWTGRCVRDRIWDSLPDHVRPMIEEPVANSVAFTAWEVSRVTPAYDYASLFKEGLQARVEKAEAKLRELQYRVDELGPAEYMDRKHQWEAMAICGRAMIRYAQRHAALAREQARSETDKVRKKELEEMAEILEWVPANPPRTFHECLQFHWIVEVIAHFMTACGGGGGAWIDQVWWPYFEADMNAGRIDREKALELVECLFLKAQDIGAPLQWPAMFSATAGFDVNLAVNICGSDRHGRDLSNDLSCIAMEAMANLNVSQPPIIVRYHRDISPDVVERAIDLDRMGMGHPSWMNEDLLRKWALTRGWSPQDAEKTLAVGCVATGIMGRPQRATGILSAATLWAVKLLEEVLGFFEGPYVPGKPELKDPRVMTSADELFDAFCERLLFYTGVGVCTWNLGQQVLMDYHPDPCNSFLMDEPLERGIDLTRLSTEYDTFPHMACYGGINVADSLAAIQRLVFEEKKYSMEELLTALQANWEGHEVMRQDFLNAPKYGNDDDYADEWTIKVLTRIHDTIGQVKDAWGYPMTIDGSTAAAYQSSGLGCGATPDGRRAGTSLNDGTVSPMPGADRNGPTAVLNSVGKIPYMHSQLLNQRFMPQFLEGENKRLFAGYLKAWHAKGTIHHIQFNVVDSKLLRDAQDHPENYTDLLVRVAGYSAFWVDLPTETQDQIILRSEQDLTGG
jgi:pyruvate formate-lyase/glycerol dehydratase family glycyl radical enzyme